MRERRDSRKHEAFVKVNTRPNLSLQTLPYLERFVHVGLHNSFIPVNDHPLYYIVKLVVRSACTTIFQTEM